MVVFKSLVGLCCDNAEYVSYTPEIHLVVVQTEIINPSNINPRAKLYINATYHQSPSPAQLFKAFYTAHLSTLVRTRWFGGTV